MISMFGWVRRPLGGLALVWAGSMALAVHAQTPAARPLTPEALFGRTCAGCHDNPATRAPDRAALRQINPEAIYAALTTGAMAPMASALDESQKRSVAEYLADRKLGLERSGQAAAMPNYCGPLAKLPAARPGDFNGWANGADGARFQPQPGGGLSGAKLGTLKLKWAFGLPGVSEIYGEPALAGGQLFVSGDTGYVYALDPASGCVRWSFQADGGVRTAVTVGAAGKRRLAFFGDIKANAYAVDARTGELAWKTQVDPHRLARVTGSPVLSHGRLYVPISSHEEWLGADPTYPCCTFSGALASLDAATGKVVWKTHMIRQAAKPTRKNDAGVQLWGPAGAAIWGAPTVDERRGAVYVSTGDGYTSPAAAATNSVVALSLKTGRKLWSFQGGAGDAWLGGCVPSRPNPNCPDPIGPDYDFAAGLILKPLPGGRSILIAGSKSGLSWGLDPDRRGAVVWRADVTRGPPDARGQIIWGGAADARSVYYGLTSGGFAAVDLKTGHVRWQTVVDPAPGLEKYRGHGGAVSVTPGAVLSGGWDGKVRAVSTDDGAVLWEFDTAREFMTVNGIPAHGGSMGAPGPIAGGGAVYVGSGIVGVQSGMAGNVLLAFGPD